MATEDDIVAALREANYEPSAAIGLLCAPPERDDDLGDLLLTSKSKKSKKNKKKKPAKAAAAAAPTMDFAAIEAALKAPIPESTAPAPARAPQPAHTPAAAAAAAAAAAPSPAPVASAAAAAPPHHSHHHGPAFPVATATPDMPDAIRAAVESSKRDMALVVLGHVDCGKSTLLGRLLFEVGQVGSDVMHRMQRDADAAGKGSFAFAWVMDQGSEERARGVTIEIAVHHFEAPQRRWALLDAPGHRDFIPSMITGVAAADVAVLVVSANPGEFGAGFERGGQTREHATLARCMGISRIIVAVNKMDLVDWDEAAFTFVQGKITKYLAAVGFKPDKVHCVPVSGLTGVNIVPAPHPLDATQAVPSPPSWWTGGTLLDTLDALPDPPRQADAPLRICIADVYHASGAGLCIAGRVESGWVTPHTRLAALPGSETLSIKHILTGGVEVPGPKPGQTQAVAWAGHTITAAVGGIDEHALLPGQVLTLPSAHVPVVTRFTANIATLPTLRIPLVAGQAFELHAHNVAVPCNVVRLKAILDGKGVPVARAGQHILRETRARVKISLTEHVALETAAVLKPLSRFVLRYNGVTVAAGTVERMHA